jgi:3-methylcrotonyl-CoA carboxylase alpha subunit
MTQVVRAAMGAAAIAAAKAVGYVGAGTAEFIADGADGLRPDRFWFMEMNTRLQVEHPVTEAVTGLDLVAWQFRIAAGEPLPLAQAGVPLQGHAVEARLYAEDPARGFIPSTGRIAALELPAGDGIRVDAGVETGSEVTPFYDPMIAKIIAHGTNRDEALDRLAGALDRTVVAGPRSNAAFLAALCRAEAFRSGAFDTGFIDRNLATLGADMPAPDRAAAASAAAHLVRSEQTRLATQAARRGDPPGSPWSLADGFTLGGAYLAPMAVTVDGERATAWLAAGTEGVAVTIDGVTADGNTRIIAADDRIYALRQGRQTVVARAEASAETAAGGGDGAVQAPMHGKLLALFVDKGSTVAAGERVAVIEAMKMEHTLTAPIAGIVTDVGAAAGDQVAEGARLLLIAPAAE